MTDLTDRLRRSSFTPSALCAEAAAEIDKIIAERDALRERVAVLEGAIQHYESALRDAWPEGAKGASWEFWNMARTARAALQGAKP